MLTLALLEEKGRFDFMKQGESDFPFEDIALIKWADRFDFVMVGQRKQADGFEYVEVVRQELRGTGIIKYEGDRKGAYTGRFLGHLLPFALAVCGFTPPPFDPLSFALFEPLVGFVLGSRAEFACRGQSRRPHLRL